MPTTKKKTVKPTPAGRKPGRKRQKLFNQTIYRDWCKACGICIAFCPRQVFSRAEDGRPQIAAPDACIGCRFCEQHCPDLAISITSRDNDNQGRKDNGP
ncbi:MAG: hypothetical protein A2521_10960 [Deltaproteobacteria bacterium RIFOXYD12_FULL_57_12]|nr:MAG: hypothetical protein A2521_10960 [Deltaproteobacteria bacterium RIFOXYD12_FULL_57_12]